MSVNLSTEQDHDDGFHERPHPDCVKCATEQSERCVRPNCGVERRDHRHGRCPNVAIVQTFKGGHNGN